MALVLSVVTGGVFAHGQQSNMGAANNQPRYNSDEREYGFGYNRVELSEEQINEIADLRDEFYNETEELRDQLRDLNRELRDLEFRDASNAEIGEVEDRIEEVLIQMNEKRAANQEKIESVLTEEQLNLIEENRLNYEGRFQGQNNNHFGPHSNRTGRRGNSRFNDGFGHGMMGREFGYGAGWCH